MYNSISHKNDSSGIDLISFDLECDGGVVGFTNCLENNKKQYEINSVKLSANKFIYKDGDCYVNLIAYKSVDKVTAKVGEILTYKVIIDNLESKEVYDIVLQDNISAGTSYIVNSMELNGAIQRSEYPQLGFIIPKIKGNSKTEVLFKVKVNSAKPLPVKVGNFSTIIYEGKEVINSNSIFTKIKYEGEENSRFNYKAKEIIDVEKNKEEIRSANKIQSESEKKYYIEQNFSNDINKQNLKEESTINLSKKYFEFLNRQIDDEVIACLSVKKIANVECVELNEIIDYKVVITNDSDINLLNIKLKDIMSENIEFIENTFKYNEVLIEFKAFKENFNIEVLKAREQILIEYKMKVKSIGDDGYVYSKTYVDYEYYSLAMKVKKGISNISESRLKVRTFSFKSINFNKTLRIKDYKTEMKSIDDVDINVNITDQYVSKCIRDKNNEGSLTSGYKIKFHGYIDVIVQYNSIMESEGIRSKAWTVLFSSYIMLPSDYKIGLDLNILYNIEYSEVDLVNSEQVSLGVGILFYV